VDGVVNARNVLIVGRSAAGSLPCLEIVYRAGRRHIGELAHGIGDAAPHRYAVVIILRRQLLGTRTAFVERLLAIPLKHQGGHAVSDPFL
jgi:hypothetical protein